MRQLFVHKVSISTSRRAAALPFISLYSFSGKIFLYIYKKVCVFLLLLPLSWFPEIWLYIYGYI